MRYINPKGKHIYECAFKKVWIEEIKGLLIGAIRNIYQERLGRDLNPGPLNMNQK